MSFQPRHLFITTLFVVVPAIQAADAPGEKKPTGEVIPTTVFAQAPSLHGSDAPVRTSYAERARSHGTRPETDPPRYVRNLANTGVDAFKRLDWLDAGLDFRERYELRENDIRRPFLATDHHFLHRTRAYLGVRKIADPLRFALEFEDARRSNSVYARDTRDVNEFELTQGYGELYFDDELGHDPLGNARPIRVRVGRMAWESLDRRMIGNNQWRNTTNNFEGVRLNLGQESNDWELDLWGVQPIVRDTDKFDSPNDDVWFFGGIVNWRSWSQWVTLQPYYLGLRQRARGALLEREVHAPGLRGYGVVSNSAIDYNLSGTYQFGHEGPRDKSAYAITVEFGYTFAHAWKPRASVFYGYASGDRDPSDQRDQRFERFFGFARPWSADDNIVFENVKTPKIKLELEPRKGLAIDGGYSWYWLASKRDRFNNLLNGINGDNRFNRDRDGQSGDLLGQAVDVRVRYKLTPRIDTAVGYSHWLNGEFVEQRQLAALGETTATTNFLYVEVSLNAFE